MNGASVRVADATGNWVDGLAPAVTRPYLRLARLDRPIGSWLLLMPCWWSLGLAGMQVERLPSLWHVLLFFVGAFAMRGAGCTWNDLVDRDLDAMVERTRSRPIPSKQVTVAQATIFMLAQALAGLLVLIQFNRFTVITGLASLMVIAIYPFMKRITYWPQIVLGLAFSWGALMGWPAAFARLDWPAFVLYAGSILWVIGYDTIYAHQDREDDLMIGIKSTALLFGERTPAMLAIFTGLVLVVGAVRPGAPRLSLVMAQLNLAAPVATGKSVLVEIDWTAPVPEGHEVVTFGVAATTTFAGSVSVKLMPA